MIDLEKGRIVAITTEREGLQELIVEINGQYEKAIHYTELFGKVAVDETVLMNTTAVTLQLGTGGHHIVVQKWHDAPSTPTNSHPGHIMKLRYTPWQRSVLACEEEDHPSHAILRDADSLDDCPVVCAELHSQVSAIAAIIGYLSSGQVRVAYVMTEGGALPIAYSRSVHELRQKGLLCGTVTVGHAYGGDLEAVNLYSGLLAAKHVLKADFVIVAMGPGVVGTGTLFGHSGIEQGQAINAVGTLKGQPIACLRMSFSDSRIRHQGISHHTLTALRKVALARATVAVPLLRMEQQSIVASQLEGSGIQELHHLQYADGSIVREATQWYAIKLNTMCRSLDEDEAFFLSAGASAIVGLRAAGLDVQLKAARREKGMQGGFAVGEVSE